MAYDKVIDSAVLEADLTSVADAIREKGGTSETLSFPDGFTEAIAAIESGGGGDDLMTAMLTDGITEYSNSEITSIYDYAFCNRRAMTNINLPALEHAGKNAFYLCFGLTDVTLPALKTSGDYLFYNCGNLISVSLPELTQAGDYLFYSCRQLKNVHLPILTTISGNIFRDCKKLKVLDFPAATNIKSYAFYQCSALNVLVLRSNIVCALENVKAFNNTPFASDGTGGSVYVPQALIESYQTATNWSTLYAAGTCNFVAIEGSEYE